VIDIFKRLIKKTMNDFFVVESDTSILWTTKFSKNLIQLDSNSKYNVVKHLLSYLQVIMSK